MDSKPNILIFCSWLSLDGNPGVFFREQAKLIESHYRPIMVTFTAKPHGVKAGLKLVGSKLVRIESKKTIEGLEVLEVVYADAWYLPSKMKDRIRSKVVSLLHSYLQENKIEIAFIHAQSLLPAGLWAYHYHKQHRVPYLMTEHNQVTLLGVKHSEIDTLRSALTSSSANLVVSKDKIRQFAANGIFGEFQPVANMISSEFHYAPGTKREKLKFLTIGAYSLIKDQITLLKALEVLDRNINEKIDFLWIGCNGWGGNETAKVEKLLSGFTFRNIDVQMMPLLSREKVATELQNSDLFLFSSISEGMPVSVLEALGCGIPVFTSNCGGVDEVVNESNGRIFPIKDFNQLASLMQEFIEGKIRFDNKKISEDILKKYGEPAFKSTLLSHYSRVHN